MAGQDVRFQWALNDNDYQIGGSPGLPLGFPLFPAG